MAKGIFRELVTINGKNVVLAHNESPVSNAGVLENADLFRMINIFAEKFSPTNIDKADGTPLRLYTSDRVKIDVSKRRKHDMGFWHRNIDAHEIIFCVKGSCIPATCCSSPRASAIARCCAKIPPTKMC